MQTKIPAEAFRKAAIKKRKGQDAEAGGSRKKPRSQSPPGSRTISRVPTPPPPRQAPAPTPPSRRSPVPTPPPQRSPTPVQPRRSSTPVPPQRSPALRPSTEPIDLTVGTPPEGSRVQIARSIEHSAPSTDGPVPGGAAQPSRAASISSKQKAVAGGEARPAASEPTGEKMGPIPLRPSIMNHPHLAEKLLSAASNSAIREEIRRTNSRTVFKECQAALLRVVNVFNHTQSLAINGERQLSRYRREAIDHRDRAVKAEDALKLAQAGEAERLEMVRSQARAESEAAHTQMRNALERALAAEGKLKAAKTEWADIKTQLEAAKLDLKSAEEKTEIAEEVARLADIKVAEATAATRAADKRAAEAEAVARATEEKIADVAERAVESYRSSQAFREEMEKAVAQAVEERAVGIAERAVENYRNSSAFIEDVAGAGADAYLHGFYECRSKALKIFGIKGLGDLEPDEDSEGEEIAQGSVPASNDAPPTDVTPSVD